MEPMNHCLRCAYSSRESGHALLLAAMLGVLGFTLWAVAFRATQDALGVAASEEQRQVRLEVLTEAVARAGHLLESGDPPYSRYRCVSRHRTAAGEWQAVVLEFQRESLNDRWMIDATLASKQDLRRLPAAPTVFSTTSQRSRL